MKRLQMLKGFDYAGSEEKVALWSSALTDRVSCVWVRDPSEPNASGYDSGYFASSVWGLDRGDSVYVARKRVSIRVDFNVPQGQKGPECDHEHAAH